MKKSISILLTLVLILSLAACGGTPATPTPAPAQPTPAAEAQDTVRDNSDITVAYAVSALTTQIFRDQVTALEAYAKEIGINFMYTACATESDKVTACENYIAMGVDVLLVHVGDALVYEDVMKEAQSKGIAWFSYDTNIEGSDAYYGWNNYSLGRAIGENAAIWINENFAEDEICNAASNNYPALPFLVERENGYRDAIEEFANCTVEWVAEGDGGIVEFGVTSGENFLQIGKEINLVVGINDSGCVGVYEAFEAAGYGTAAGSRVAIFGCDSDPEALELISKGTIYKGSINTGLVALAPDFIDICVDLANGQGGGDHWGDFIKVTIDNVADYM